MELFNVYCDESCHLEHDDNVSMVLGGIWCPADKVRAINARVRDIIKKHQLSKNFEIKWTKLSQSKIDFYLDLLDFFYDDDDLHFRALVIPDKTILDHERFDQTHDDWYYKMYFDMLKIVINPSNYYNIYLDIKDTHGAKKALKLKEVLSNNMYDFSMSKIRKIQLIRSYESPILQLTDLLIGSLSYLHRGLATSEAKKIFLGRFKDRSGYSLLKSTFPSEQKTNIFIWRSCSNV